MRDPSKSADAWAAGMASSQARIVDGINAVTVEPNQKAAQAASKYMMATADAVNSGGYAAANNAVPPGYWKSQFIAKVGRVAQGAATAKPKMQSFLSKLKPVMDGIQSTINGMDSSTYEAKMARQRAYADAMHATKGRYK